MNNSLPLGFKHWNKSDPALYVEWGLLLLVAAIKNIFGIKTYNAKHMREVTPWIVKKIEDVSMARDLLANIISVQAYRWKKKGEWIAQEIKQYVQQFYLKSGLWTIVMIELVKMPIHTILYSVRRR